MTEAADTLNRIIDSLVNVEEWSPDQLDEVAEALQAGGYIDTCECAKMKRADEPRCPHHRPRFILRWFDRGDGHEWVAYVDANSESAARQAWIDGDLEGHLDIGATGAALPDDRLFWCAELHPYRREQRDKWVAQWGANLHDGCELDDEPDRFLLIQTSTYDSSLWIETFPNDSSAIDGYINSEEYPGDWTTTALIDLDTGRAYDPVETTHTTWTPKGP